MKKENDKSIFHKAGNALKGIKDHWNTPAEGKYIPYKEVVSYSVGGIGVKFVIYVVCYIGLSGTSLLAGSALGLKNGDLVKLNMIATVIGIGLGFLRGMIIDNTRSKKGKFRPYLLFAGIPSAAIVTLFAFLPFETMSYNQRLWSLFVTYILLQICYPFYDQAYNTLVQVMSPNSNERAEVITVSTLVYSIAPTILGFIVPIIAGYTGGLEKINAYRVIMPVFGIVGAILGIVSYTGTKERIIVSKDYTPKVPFFYGVMQGMNNKYQWARSLTSWFVLFQMGIGNVTTWYFYYGIKDTLNLTTEQQGVMNGTLVTVLGAAATPAMLLAPMIIKKIGKRNLVILYTVCNIFCMIGMYLSIRHIWLLFVFTWIRGFFGTFTIITDPALNADVLDYQQYKTGDRLEGLMGQFVGFVGTFISMGITYFIQKTVLQNRYGLVDNYDDLYQASFREPMAKAVIVIAIVGYALSLIPFVLMYTLTEQEHNAHISVLKIRAALADFASGTLSEGELINAKEIYFDAKKRYESLSNELKNEGSKKKQKKIKAELKALEIIIDEKNRFQKPEMLKKLEKAQELASHTPEELYGISEPSMDKYNAAKAMSENTAQEIKQKDAAVKLAEKELNAFNKKAFKYIEARKLVKQYEYYLNWQELFETEKADA